MQIEGSFATGRTMQTILSVVLILIGTILFSVLYTISLQPKTLSLRVGEKAFRLCGRIRFVSMIFELAVVAGYVLFALGGRCDLPLSSGNALPTRIVGASVAFVCLSFMTYATIKAGSESASPRQETTLHHGIYDFMRHPQTLGEMLSWFGISIALNSLTLLLYSLVWLPLFIGFTVIEDNDLALRFGESYRVYSRGVGIFWRKGRHLRRPNVEE